MNQELSKKTIKSFTDLVAWKEAHTIVLDVYRITKNFPREELFGLTNQLRRAVVSITSNVAESFSRNSYKEKVRFYSMSLGSLTEAQNQLLIAKDIEYIPKTEFEKLNEKIFLASKLLNGLIKKSKTLIYNS